MKEEGPPAVASVAPTCRNLCTSIYNTAIIEGFPRLPHHAHPSIVLLIGVNFTRVGPRGSHRLASSPPRPLAPSRGVGSFPSRHQAAIGRYALLRCGEVSFGRPARLRRRHKPGDGLKRVFKNECPACSSAAPVAAPGGKVAERGAGVIIYGRYVLARRVSRAGAQFESRIVLLHLRNACPSRF